MSKGLSKPNQLIEFIYNLVLLDGIFHFIQDLKNCKPLEKRSAVSDVP